MLGPSGVWFLNLLHPQPFSNGNFIYKVSDDKSTVSILSYIGIGGAIEIPSQANGKNVIAVETNAFQNHTEIISIVVPESVTNIGDNAFSGCSNLQTIEIQNPSAVISNFVNIPEQTIIKANVPSTALNYAIENSKAFNDGNFTCRASSDGQTVSIIGYTGSGGAVIVPSQLNGINIVAIGADSFKDQTAVTSVEVPSSVATVESGAFTGCTNLQTIEFKNPDTVINDPAGTAIPSQAIIKATTGSNVLDYAQAHGIEYDEITDFVFDKTTGTITGYTGPGGAVEIPSKISGVDVVVIASAFQGKDTITSVTIPNSVTVIGREAFSRCTNLISVNIPTNITSIGKYAFYCCSNLESINLSNIIKIEEGTFNSCSNLKNIVLPNTLQEIEMGAFTSCRSLVNLNIPSSVTIIGIGAFTRSGLANISFSNSSTILSSADTIPEATTITGYYPSTAYDYALKYGRSFQPFVNVTIPDLPIKELYPNQPGNQNINVPAPGEFNPSPGVPGSPVVNMPDLGGKVFTPNQPGSINTNIPDYINRDLKNNAPGASAIDLPGYTGRDLSNGQQGQVNISKPDRQDKTFNPGNSGNQNVNIPQAPNRELHQGQGGVINVNIGN